MQGIPYFYVMNVIMKEKYENMNYCVLFFIIFPYTIMQIYGLFSSRRHIVLIISNSNQRCDVTTFHRIVVQFIVASVNNNFYDKNRSVVCICVLTWAFARCIKYDLFLKWGKLVNSKNGI